MAYACRYGCQPLPVVLSMTWEAINRFNAALGRIVKKENEP